ncbi:MAG TPA: NAD(P)H-binding protein [Actinomycetota bacterium]|nr:NAD(P)H-binding protein [Actinomycetota bacterium]
MKIAVFGAAGRTGREVVRQALDRGHEVTAFVRDESVLDSTDERLSVVAGDARDAEAVERALAQADGVISVLALTSADAEPGYSEATKAVVEAASRTGVHRLVVAANNDVLSDREVTGEFAAHAREHRRNRETLEASGLDWTIGAAPWVTDDPATGTYQAAVDQKGPGRRLGAADFATFTLDALERGEWIGHVVGVSA